MKKLFVFIILMSILCFSTTNVYSNSNGMRFIYQALPVNIGIKTKSTIFYKIINYQDVLYYTGKTEFDSADQYGLEFFKTDVTTITFGGIYINDINKIGEGNNFNSTSFLVGFGGGYTNKFKDAFRFEITPYGQIGMSQYTVDYDEENIADDESDWGFCWQGGVKGSLMVLLGDKLEIGVNAGYIYYRQNYVAENKDSYTEELTEYEITSSGPTFGATVGILF